MSPRRPARAAAALLAATAVLLGACAAGDPSRDGPAAVDHGPLPPDHDVVLTEMAIAAPSVWPTGSQVLRVRNEGGAHHNLIVCPGDERGCDEGGGVPMDVVVKPEVRDPDVVPDRTSSLVLGAGAEAVVQTDALTPGSYLLWCAIPNHAARGMQRVIEVE